MQIITNKKRATGYRGIHVENALDVVRAWPWSKRGYSSFQTTIILRCNKSYIGCKKNVISMKAENCTINNVNILTPDDNIHTCVLKVGLSCQKRGLAMVVQVLFP